VTQFTYPGVPSVYYGDEIGMEGGKDPDDRRCMIWDKSQWDMHLYRLHRALIALRKTRPSLTAGDFRVVSANDAMGRFVFQRRLGKETTTVILNRGPVPVACSAYVPSGKVLAGTGPTVPAGSWAVVGS
jgi:cyclomaltodextrinase / maltogenic alpha-amylase / neopullulanase